MMLTIPLVAIQVAAAPPALAPQDGFHAGSPALGATGKRCPDDMLRYAGQGVRPWLAASTSSRRAGSSSRYFARSTAARSRPWSVKA